MRVILLGAGASKGAGYPLTQELLAHVAEEASSSTSAQFRQAWERWHEFVESYSGPLEFVVRNPNPEVVFSLPDLFDLAVRSQDEARMADAFARHEGPIEERVKELEDHFASASRSGLTDATTARSRLMSALTWYFWFKHHDDIDRRADRGYLRELLKPVGSGDVVITLNWDTLAERTLGEMGKWSPLDGYGFSRPIRVSYPLGRTEPLPSHLATPSDVKVLKLHGSFGWAANGASVYLERIRLLSGFRFAADGHHIELVDEDEPDLTGIDAMFVAYPSFLKDLSHPVIASTWKRASEALLEADRVDVFGYSLPESDGALRALLHPLAVRLERGETRVSVTDPSERTLDRWKTALGAGITTNTTQLG